MSERYPGGIINQTAPVPTGPYATGTAPGVWTMDQQAYWVQQGLWPIPGNFPNYIEDVFGTYLYTGTGATQTINNGIDLAGKGGLTWIKRRGSGTGSHELFDTVRGVNKYLSTNSTAAQDANGSYTDLLNSFNSNGFTLGADASLQQVNSVGTGDTYCSWTFREQAKFFDVVTYTGDGTANRAVPHNLGSVPGMIIVKKIDGTAPWQVYHRSLPTGTYGVYNLVLNTTAAQVDNGQFASTADSTNFYVNQYTNINASGATMVAYLFAHDAGGFGLSGTDNVISCGSFTTDGSGNASISLGYEPQYVISKPTTTTGNWNIEDVMRGMTVDANNEWLKANLTNATQTTSGFSTKPNATGFNYTGLYSSTTYIYMAIRRPMKVPTDATTVFSPIATTDSENTFKTTGFTIDLQMQGYRPGISNNIQTIDRLRGVGTIASTSSSVPKLSTSSTAAESSVTASNGWNNTGFQISSAWDGNDMVYWNFRRATGFFDVVCYTGTGSIRNLTHNLGSAPDMVIVRGRSSNTAGEDWAVWHRNGSQANGYLGARLNTTQAYRSYGQSLWQNDTTAPNMNSSTISLGTNDIVNGSGKTYVAYLFGTVAGVSKVGSYTGTGATQTINCGFTGGARFVLIKRTDSTGNWYVWDTARGMVSGTDPSLLLNSTAAEVNANSVYTATTGFQIVSTAAGINASGGSYIFLAIA